MAGVALECAFDLIFHSMPFIIVYISAVSMQKTDYFFPESVVIIVVEQLLHLLHLLHLSLFSLKQIHKNVTVLSKLYSSRIQ